MQIVQKFRYQLPRMVTEELDNIIASIVSFFGVEHNEDGTHGHIHADSITIGGVPITPGSGGGGEPGPPGPEGPMGPAGATGATGPAGPMPALLETFVTANPEPTLANHRQLKAGTNITLDATTPGWLVVNGQAGGSAGMNLDYLGDYAAGPVYMDGDIVIGADGIAYMCVVDNTTTPPEPWPGQGMAVNATVDATYWVVSGHAALTNERVMSALANGYVKSTGGEPSTVAIIPVAEGGTGATTPATARTNLGVGNVGTLNTNGDPNAFLNGAGAWAYPPQPPAVSGVVAGSIIFFTTPCPAGYTRVAGWDGYYVRMGPAHVAGGANSHSHGPGTYASQNHTHGVGSIAAGSHTHPNGTLTVDAHNHGSINISVSVSGSTGNAGGHDHTYSGETSTDNGGNMNVDAGGSGVMSRFPHKHTFSGNTSTVGAHNHSFSGSGSGSDTTDNASPGVDGDTGAATPPMSGATASAGAAAITGGSDAQWNMPLYIDFYACRKD